MLKKNAKSNESLKSKGSSQFYVQINLTSFCGPAITFISNKEQFTIDDSK